MKRAILTLSCLSILAAGCGRSLDLTKEHNQLNFGVEAARMNLWREALFRSQRAVQINPADAMARNNLAVAYEGTGDFDKARLSYLEALKLDKSNQYIQKNYSRFVEFTAKNKKREKAAVAPAAKSLSPGVTPAPATSDPDALPPSAARHPEPQPTPVVPPPPPHGGAR